MNNFFAASIRKLGAAFKQQGKKYLITIILVILAVLITFTITYASCLKRMSSILDEYGLDDGVMSKIANIKNAYEQMYVGGELDSEKMGDAAAQGLIYGTGDKYGYYYGKEEFSSMMQENDGSMVGIGINVIYNPTEGTVTIVNVYEDSPAAEAGLKVDDQIVGVDDITLEEAGYNTLVDTMLGEEGTQVTVHILRDGKAMDITATRKKMDIVSVKWEMLEDTVGYIKITEFNMKTQEQFESAMTQMTQQHPDLTGIVFDVRDNGGGDTRAIEGVLDDLLPEGTIYELVYKDGEKKTYTSDADTMLPEGVKLAVLTNGNTASAAELFTAALQDYGLAKSVGENTYGKGTALSVIGLNDGSGFTISDALYYTPAGRNLEDVGIAPDVEVVFTEEQKANRYTMTKEEDTQLQKALDVVRG